MKKFDIGELIQLNPKIFNDQMIKRAGLGLIKEVNREAPHGCSIYEIIWTRKPKELGIKFLGRYISSAKENKHFK